MNSRMRPLLLVMMLFLGTAPALAEVARPSAPDKNAAWKAIELFAKPKGGLPPGSSAQRAEVLARDFEARFTEVASEFGLSLAQIMQLSASLGETSWRSAATKMGVAEVDALREALLSLPHKNDDQLTPYNLMTPAKDRWGLTAKQGLEGWRKYGLLIEEVAVEHGIDPLILGAYVWTESNFDTNQDYAARGLRAVGLTSVQVYDYPKIAPTLSQRVAKLKTDPKLNLRLCAQEFRSRWKPEDMFATVMDVWYPAWRRRDRIPALGTAYGYMQLFSNRYFLLMSIMSD